MKKYRHKPTGKIVTFERSDYVFMGQLPYIRIPAWVVENSSDWEEIKEKKWTIMAFYNPALPNQIWKRRTVNFNCLDGNYPEITEEYGLREMQIHSVMRLADKEIFTIGNKVDVLGLKFNISGIALIKDTISLEGSALHTMNYLEDAAKIKSIFQTDDGKDICPGDKVWLVDLNDDKTLFATEVFEAPPYCLKSFFNENAAIDYVIKNKPCLCIRDFDECWSADKEKEMEFLETRVREKLGHSFQEQK